MLVEVYFKKITYSDIQHNHLKTQNKQNIGGMWYLWVFHGFDP